MTKKIEKRNFILKVLRYIAIFLILIIVMIIEIKK